MPELIFSEKQFKEMSVAELVSAFEESKNISIEFSDKNTLSLTYLNEYVVSSRYPRLVNLLSNKKLSSVILLRHLKYNPPHWSEPDEEGTYTIINDIVISSLDYVNAIQQFKSYYENIGFKKKLIIPKELLSPLVITDELLSPLE